MGIFEAKKEKIEIEVEKVRREILSSFNSFTSRNSIEGLKYILKHSSSRKSCDAAIKSANDKYNLSNEDEDQRNPLELARALLAAYIKEERGAIEMDELKKAPKKEAGGAIEMDEKKAPYKKESLKK